MYSLKFYKKPFEDGSELSVMVAAKSFKRYQRADQSVEFTVYDTLTQAEGVTFIVSADEQDYQACFIENANGKTIGAVRMLESDHD